jgi:hypothetical protein
MLTFKWLALALKPDPMKIFCNDYFYGMHKAGLAEAFLVIYSALPAIDSFTPDTAAANEAVIVQEQYFSNTSNLSLYVKSMASLAVINSKTYQSTGVSYKCHHDTDS